MDCEPLKGERADPVCDPANDDMLDLLLMVPFSSCVNV